MKIKLTIYSILLLSLLCSIFSFFALSGVMLPYQDATQVMLNTQTKDIYFWELFLLGSLLMNMICIIAVYLIRYRTASVST